jgi:uncharacterized SAM-binding protein YcdF (DUF218 family)
VCATAVCAAGVVTSASPPPPFAVTPQVLRDLFLALGTKEQQVLPLEVESLNCGGNARCSMELIQRLGLKPNKVLMIQVSHGLSCQQGSCAGPAGILV